MTSKPSPDRIRGLIGEFYAAWSRHEPERIDAIVTLDVVYEDVASGQVHRGPQAVEQQLEATYAWSADFRVTMISCVAGDDAAASEWVMEGTHTGPLDDHPSTGRAVRLRGASIFAFRDGRISRVTDYHDMTSFRRQVE